MNKLCSALLLLASSCHLYAMNEVTTEAEIAAIIQKHKQAHQQRASTQFYCDRCKEVILLDGKPNTPIDINAHAILMHASCDICNESFKTLADINDHLMKKHDMRDIKDLLHK